MNAAANRSAALVWWRIEFGRDVDPDAVRGLAASVVADRRRHRLVFETALQPHKSTFLLGADEWSSPRVRSQLRETLPGTQAEEPAVRWALPTNATVVARRIRVTTRQRSLDIAEAATAARTLHGVATRLRRGELAVVQWVLGPRLAPSAVPNRLEVMPAESLRDLISRTVNPARSPVDTERRQALRSKMSEAGVRLIGRVLVAAATRGRAESVVADVLGALATLEAPGVRLMSTPERATAVIEARSVWRWPLSLNVSELAAVLAWPVGDISYPSVERSRTRLLPPSKNVPSSGRVVGESTWPGEHRPVALNAADATMHTLVSGVTGSGKSTLLAHLVATDIAKGRGVVVIDPKGGLVDDVLAHIPDERRDDVVVLDPADADMAVGLNPLSARFGPPEVVVDQVMAVIHGVFGDSLGSLPRTSDVLYNAMSTLIRDPKTASLAALPVLLSNPAFRRRIVGGLDDPLVLGPFWAWFDKLSDSELRQVLPPAQHRLRPFTRPQLREVLGQVETRFEISEVFTKRRVLLVNLAKGQLGPETAQLLGALVVAQLWAATQSRAAIPASKRHPVMVYIDEFHDYLHLPTALDEVLAQARGLGVGVTLAHQHLDQLTKPVRDAVLANARSKIVFQVSAKDAAVFAKHADGLESDDFVNLGRFEAYATLMASQASTPWLSMRTLPADAALSKPSRVRAASRRNYGRPRVDVDAELRALVEPPKPEGGVGKRPRRPQ